MTTLVEKAPSGDLFGGFVQFLGSVVAPLRKLFADDNAASTKQSQRQRAFAELAIAMASPFLIAKTEAQYEAAERFCQANARKIRELVEAVDDPAAPTPAEALRPPNQELFARGLMLDFEEHLVVLVNVMRVASSRPGSRMPKQADVHKTIDEAIGYMVPVAVAALRDEPNYSKWAVARAHSSALRSLVIYGRLFQADDSSLATTAALRRVAEHDAAQMKAAEDRAAKLQRSRDEDFAASDWMR